MGVLLRILAFLLFVLATIAALGALTWNAHALAYAGLAAWVLSGFPPLERIRL